MVMTPRDAGPRAGTTDRALAFVAAHRDAAERLGAALADDVTDATLFSRSLERALEGLADEEYRTGQAFVAPGIGRTLGVRSPLLARLSSAFLRASRGTSSSDLLLAADRVLRAPHLESRWVGYAILRHVLPDEPERAWQLLRRAAGEASDWISVDRLARVYARGILAEPYRWAELEQLVYSPTRWERRLVGSTIATIPFEDPRRGREREVGQRGLALIGDLIGDGEPDVQKALSWALRSLSLVDRAAVAAFCAAEARRAAETDDGHRAWVIRDALSSLARADADALRRRLAGVRRRTGAPPTSRAAETAGRFRDLGLGRPMPEPPLA